MMGVFMLRVIPAPIRYWQQHWQQLGQDKWQQHQGETGKLSG